MLWLAVLFPLLTACSAMQAQRRVQTQTERTIESSDPRKAESVHADLIRGMLAQGQYYAALAHVQGQVRETGATPELRLLEAEARRKLGQKAEALAIYQSLLKTPYVAEAYHGIGLIGIGSNLSAGIANLQQAATRRPTNALMRNDLGYALMIAGRYAEALPELATAVELEGGSGDGRARNNLVVLMILRGDEASVKQLAQAGGMSDEALATLRRQAAGLRRVSAPAVPASTAVAKPAAETKPATKPAVDTKPAPAQAASVTPAAAPKAPSTSANTPAAKVSTPPTPKAAPRTGAATTP
jgi:Flp pilus assembly protein TadD